MSTQMGRRLRLSAVFAVLGAALPANAQQKIHLPSQSRTADFSAFSSTKPFATGTALPVTCAIGEAFFKTGSPAGASLYLCTAIDVWSVQASAPIDLATTRTLPTVLTIGVGCGTSTPCNVRFGNTVFTFTASATATIVAGSGTAFIYVSADGLLTVGHPMTVSCSGCTAIPGVTAFPADSVPLATWAGTNAVWSTTGTDRRAWLGNKPVSGGAGLIAVDAGGRTTLSVDGGFLASYATATLSINFPSIPSGECSADETLAVAGAAVGDSVASGWPAGLDAGLTGTMRVSAAGTVAVRLCNLSASAVNPSPATFRATVVRGF